MRTDSIVTHGATFFVTDSDGFVSRDYDGFYHQDTRHLDRHAIEADTALKTLSIDDPIPGKRIVHAASEEIESERPLYLRREQVATDSLYERIRVQNLTDRHQAETLTISVGTSFDDIFEIRGYSEEVIDREVHLTELDGGVRFDYEATDIDFSRTTSVVTNADTTVEVGQTGERADATLSLSVELPPREECTLWIACVPGDAPSDITTAGKRAFDQVDERFDGWLDNVDLPEVPDQDTNAALTQSVEDLLRLTLDTEHGPVPAAGLPWFATPFGRDSLIAAFQTLPLTTDLARGTLHYLAAHQATEHDAYRGAEPGKIMHEIRRGELAARGDVPHTPYYGTIDATALWVVLLHETWKRTGDDALVEKLSDNLDAALSWLDEYGDRDGDGFLEYPTDQGDDGGLTHQAWKDSNDGVVYPDGSHPDGDLAIAEAQGYYYDAKVRAAELYRVVRDDADRALQLDREAADLKAAFDEAFWLPDEEFYAIALDGDNDPIASVTSNPGHCLWSGIVPDERADAVVNRLLADDMFSGWGIRTNAATHDSYNPISYHRGSVWPHDNSLTVLGFARYGRDDAVETVAGALLDAATTTSSHRLPELFAGLPRTANEAPVPYGTACEPQAWSAGTVVACLSALGETKTTLATSMTE
ncbi:amylo-alpha-1,6-glucosidase [Haladaptatus sp. NG-SE-30]